MVSLGVIGLGLVVKPGNASAQPADSVTICFNGVTLSLPRVAVLDSEGQLVPAYASATLGPCAGDENEARGESEEEEDSIFDDRDDGDKHDIFDDGKKDDDKKDRDRKDEPTISQEIRIDNDDGHKDRGHKNDETVEVEVEVKKTDVDVEIGDSGVEVEVELPGIEVETEAGRRGADTEVETKNTEVEVDTGNGVDVEVQQWDQDKKHEDKQDFWKDHDKHDCDREKIAFWEWDWEKCGHYCDFPDMSMAERHGEWCKDECDHGPGPMSYSEHDRCEPRKCDDDSMGPHEIRYDDKCEKRDVCDRHDGDKRHDVFKDDHDDKCREHDVCDRHHGDKRHEVFKDDHKDGKKDRDHKDDRCRDEVKDDFCKDGKHDDKAYFSYDGKDDRRDDHRDRKDFHNDGKKDFHDRKDCEKEIHDPCKDFDKHDFDVKYDNRHKDFDKKHDDKDRKHDFDKKDCKVIVVEKKVPVIVEKIIVPVIRGERPHDVAPPAPTTVAAASQIAPPTTGDAGLAGRQATGGTLALLPVFLTLIGLAGVKAARRAR